MQLSATSTFSAAQFTPPPPPPPSGGPDFGKIHEEIYHGLDVNRAQAGILAEAAARTGRTAPDAISIWKSAYAIPQVMKDEATVLTAVTLIGNGGPNAIKDAYDAAYSIASVMKDQAMDIATRTVLRGHDPAQIKPTFDDLYKISDVMKDQAQRMTVAAVSAGATSKQVTDAYTWYRSQPSATAQLAVDWTVGHLRELAGGFDAYHDGLLVDLRARVAAAR